MKTKDYIFILLAFLLFWLATNKRANDYLFGEEGVVSASDTTFHSPEIVTVNVPAPRSQSLSASDIRYIIEQAQAKNDYGLIAENKYLKEHLAYIQANPDSIKGDIKTYKDSSVNKDVNIYYSALTRGDLLNMNLSYKLKGVKSIATTKTKLLQQGKLYMTFSGGGNKTTFNDLSPGLFYSSKGRMGAGYEYNLLDNTHRAKLGVLLFQHK